MMQGNMTRLEWAFQNFNNTLEFVRNVREEIVFQMVTQAVNPDRENVIEWIKAVINVMGKQEMQVQSGEAGQPDTPTADPLPY